jgi:hypothetical protein
MVLSGTAHQALPGDPAKFARGRSPDLQMRLAEPAGDLADFENIELL